ncbi:5-hydroxytryptamine receptor 1F [Hoplias malabaricus]|uniref:5-hydroxytryptamine receptor 1F n=1 Tax=Hoplias malabaricus TaxID=27720 RepID=UPI003462040A
MELPGSRWLDPSEPLLGEMRLAWTNSTSSGLSGAPSGGLLLEVLMVLMCVGAVTGNILVIVIVVATKTFHSVTSVLIINLAISDFLVGIGVMPFVAVSIMNNGWVNCNDLCLYVGYTSSVYCTASVLTLAAIALDRYYSIMDCLRYDARCTVWRTGAAVLWIWLQAMLTSSPPLFGWSSVSFVKPMYSCSVNWASSPSYTVFMAALTFLLPATVILFCYVKIVRVARHHARRIHSLEEHLQRSRGHPRPDPSEMAHQCSATDVEAHDPSRLVYYVSGRFVSEAQFDAPQRDLAGGPAPHPEGESSSKPSGRRLHTFLAHLQSSSTHQASHPHHGIMRLFMVIAAFFLCWTPYISVALVQATETALSRSVSQVPPAVVTFSYWLVLFNSDINPLLYALLSKRFKGALQNLKQKIQARLGGVVRRGGERRTDGGGCTTPTNVTAANVEQHSRDGGPGYASVFTVNAAYPRRYRERLNEGLLPGSLSSSSNSSLSTTTTSSSSLWNNCSGNTPERSECLQVPCKSQERDRPLSSATTKERQTTFFYGQITVRVEHEIC